MFIGIGPIDIIVIAFLYFIRPIFCYSFPCVVENKQ